MTDYNDLLRDSQRLTVMDSLPGSTTNRQIFTNLIFNGATSTGSFSITNNAWTTITTTVTAKPDANTIIAAVPITVAFFQGTTDTTNLIPDINLNGWTVQGPIPMPNVIPYYVSSNPTNGIGNNGKNIVFRTYIKNTTGSTQTVFYFIGTRLISFAAAGK